MRKLLASLALGLAVLGFSATSFAADDAASAASAPAAAMAAASAPAADASAPAAAAAASGAASTPTIVETVNKGDTTWMLVSTVLVIMMSIPALALFYGGLVRSKNMLSVLMQVFVTFSLIVILWFVYGYSLAFTEGNKFIGGFSRLFLNGIFDPATGKFTTASTFSKGVMIPELSYVVFQATFAAITCCLIVGSFAERIKFSAVLAFMVLWFTFSYLPIAHMVWFWEGPDAYTSADVVDKMNAGAGMIWQWGALDFAGGTVVHINAAIAGLVGAYCVGKRIGYGKEAFTPHSTTLTMVGASLLWVGWFGFNAGSAVASNGRAGIAMTATQVATAAAALAWMFSEWIVKGKPSALGAASGAVAGLVAITPASGFVLPGPALIIGIAAGVICFWASTSLKHALGYDDSLDVWGVHGMGGIVGALLTGVFAYQPFTGTLDPKTNTWSGGNVGGLPQFEAQVIAVVTTLVWSGVISFIILKVVDVIVGLRVSPEEEREGLDIVLHGETLG